MVMVEVQEDQYQALVAENVQLRMVAENAMHTLLHVDADMTERVETAKSIASAIGHPWPPYQDDNDDDD